MDRIDAHQHYWQPARGDYGWLTPSLSRLYRDYLPADLRPQLAAAGVTRTVLVQAAPTVAETEYMLALARSEPSVAAVVGWVDLRDPALAALLNWLLRQGPLRGIRPMLQDLPDPDWIAAPDLAPAVSLLVQHDLAFDALVTPSELPALLTFAERHPELRIVIDHAAKPPLQGDAAEMAAWRQGLMALARCPQVDCKLSGLATQAGPGWQAASFEPVLDLLLTHFGPQRLIWGSDWPVLLEAGDYARWVEASEQLLGGCSSQERAAIYAGNAARFYRL